MTDKQLQSLGESEQNEILEAYKMGVRACLFLAREIETTFQSMSKLSERGRDGKALPVELLMPGLEFSIDPAMQTMADLLNNMDAVDDEAEQATERAFERVRYVLDKYGFKPGDQNT